MNYRAGSIDVVIALIVAHCTTETPVYTTNLLRLKPNALVICIRLETVIPARAHRLGPELSLKR